MEHKKTIKKIIYFALGFFFLALFFGWLDNKYELYLPDEIIEVIIQTFAFFPLALVFISLPLLFLHEEIFQSWKKFAKIYLSISVAIILLFMFSSGGGGNFGLGGGMDAEGATMFLSALFFIISLVIIITKSLKLRGK